MHDGLRDQGRIRQMTRSRHIGVAGAIAACVTIALSGCAGGHDDSERATEQTGGRTAEQPVDEPSRDQGAAKVSVVHRTPTCGCCKDYEAYLRKHGYSVESVVADDLAPIRAEHGIPESAASCHTMVIDRYAVEGHVPVEAIEALLAERPGIEAIALPGMPPNSPGMGPPNGEPLEIVSIDDAGRLQPFMTL